MSKAGTALLVIALTGLCGQGAFCSDGDSDYYAPRAFETRPGIYFYLFQDDALWQNGVLSVEHHATTDCLTPPVAMEVAFPAVDGPAGFLALDLDQTLPTGADSVAVPMDATGVSFWVKGDGSGGTGRIELREDYGSPGAAYEFALSEKGWRRILVKWSQFAPAPDVSKVAGLCFGIGASTARPARYVVDALRFVKSDAADEDLARAAEAASSAGAAVDIPVRPAPGSCVYNTGGLARARAKVRRGEPLKWLAYGDSVTVPVQLWNIPNDLHRTQYAYYAAAAESLHNEFGCKIDVVVNAVGGRQLNEDFESLLSSLATEKPDVLVLLSGDTIENYEVLMPKVLEAARAAGTEVLVVIPTYDPMPLRVASFDWLRRFCIENNVACADARTCLLGVPEASWGDTTANDSHPNALGHRIIAQVVAAMFR